jgi:hypothetical protein
LPASTAAATGVAHEGICSPHETTHRLTPDFGFAGSVGTVPVSPLYAAASVAWAASPLAAPPAAALFPADVAEPPEPDVELVPAQALSVGATSDSRIAALVRPFICSPDGCCQPVP